MTKTMTIVYSVHDGLYINLTNRCLCACTFCIRQSADSVHGSDPLWLDHEPAVSEVIAALQNEDMTRYKEVVFCGYGEPTERLDALLEVAAFVKETYRLPVRINTNGLGNLIHQKDITPLLAGKIDVLSISLNSSDPHIYESTVRPRFGEKAYPALLEFARRAAQYVPRVVMTTVATTITREDEERCRALCAELGVTYRIRAFVEQ